MSGYRPYNKSLDTCAYIFGIIGIAALVTSGHFIIPKVPPCLFHTLTGLYCPGCGGTRALSYMLSGHLIKSFYHHPIVLYAAIFGIPFILSQTVYRIRRRLNTSSSPENIHFPILTVKPWFAYTACIIIILQCIIKNLILLIFHYPIIG